MSQLGETQVCCEAKLASRFGPATFCPPGDGLRPGGEVPSGRSAGHSFVQAATTFTDALTAATPRAKAARWECRQGRATAAEGGPAAPSARAGLALRGTLRNKADAQAPAKEMLRNTPPQPFCIPAINR